ncbi:MAG: hypothetical protein U9N38_05260, partial [Thermodesulfobacteriota bacterium]|nr:hypothetical protein [Thermodesulfobacteriota bacterium]
VWLNGIGESCLDPKLIERTRVIKNVMGDKEVGLCTNGVNMTLEMAKALRGSGLDRLDLSPHSPFHVRRAASYMIKAGWVGRSVINLGIFNATHNWCGQLEPENQVETHLNHIQIKCDPLIEGRGYVLKEGNVTPCCYDYRNLGVFGNVFDDDLLRKPIKPYELCKDCHQKIPKEIMEKANEGMAGGSTERRYTGDIGNDHNGARV